MKNKLSLDFACKKRNALFILIIFLVLIVILVGIYYTRFSTDYHLFRVSGDSIGDYKSGSLVIAKKVSDPLSLKKGDAVLYKVDAGGSRVERLGLILALPQESKIKTPGVFTLDNSFVIGTNDKIKDLVPKSDVDWKIIKKI